MSLDQTIVDQIKSKLIASENQVETGPILKKDDVSNAMLKLIISLTENALKSLL